MKGRFEKLGKLVNIATSDVRNNISTVKDTAVNIGASTLIAAKSAQIKLSVVMEESRQVIIDTIDHDDTKAAVTKAKEVVINVSNEAKKIANGAVEVAMKVEENHKEFSEKIETVAMGLGMTSGVVAEGAFLAAPTGISAAGVALGVLSAPLIVTAAPIVGAAATAVGAVSAGAYFYSRWKTNKDGLASKDVDESS